MNKTEIATGIIRYQFPPHEDKHFGFKTNRIDPWMASAVALERTHWHHQSNEKEVRQ